MGSIIKRCGCQITAWDRCPHPWLVRWREPGGRSGRQREKSFEKGAAGRKLAEKFERKVERDKDTGAYIDPKQSQRTFADVWHEWLSAGADENALAESSRVQYRSIYKNHFEEFFGPRPIGAVTASDITQWETAQKEKGYKPYGIHTRKVVLASVFKYAWEAEIIARNPAKKADPRKRKDPAYRPIDPSEVPTTGEVEAIFESIRPYYRSAIWSMAGCGHRVGEALALCETKWDQEAGFFVVNAQLATFGENEGAGRTTAIRPEVKWSRHGRLTPVPDVTRSAWGDHLSTFGTWGDEGWFYESETYASRFPARTTFQTRWNKAIEKAGLEDRKLTPKSLRHYFASVAIGAGVPLPELAKWMGHASSKTTEHVYVHLLPGAEERIKGAVALAVAQNLSDALTRVTAA
ncbi:tyrosine-type recombinase/integrase [Streptomyces sp. NPDC047108]|uniref:tyrosine-type recombinase/integrase n=1 Tax=Streptomyces sp. NPDC047108 TaxID=3155025 RepID=UPI0034072084